MTIIIIALIIYVGSIAFVRLRNKDKFPFVRQLSDFSTFMVIFNLPSYLLSRVPMGTTATPPGQGECSGAATAIALIIISINAGSLILFIFLDTLCFGDRRNEFAVQQPRANPRAGLYLARVRQDMAVIGVSHDGVPAVQRRQRAHGIEGPGRQ